MRYFVLAGANSLTPDQQHFFIVFMVFFVFLSAIVLISTFMIIEIINDRHDGRNNGFCTKCGKPLRKLDEDLEFERETGESIKWRTGIWCPDCEIVVREEIHHYTDED